MVRKHKKNTSFLKHITLGEDDYFPSDIFPSIETKMQQVNLLSSRKPRKAVYGVFNDNDEYLLSLDTLMASTYETEHRNYMLYHEIIATERLPYGGKFLDVGIGNGDLTKFIGMFFSNITIVDTEPESLNNVPNQLGIKNYNVTKINASILDESGVYATKYDFILLSHVLYYIPAEKIIPLIKKLYTLLNPSGYMLIIYNSSGDRADLLKYFNKSFKDLDPLDVNCSYDFASLTIYRSPEYLMADNINAMMNILDVCLNDSGTNITDKQLSDYLESGNYYENGYYKIGMQQNIVLIGNTNED